MPRDGLHFDDVPPISVPFRFFLTAPVYLLLTAALLLWRGPEAFASRLSPAALAATHLVALGFLSMVMIGATIQLLAVVAGAPLRWPRQMAGVVWVGINTGTLALAAGFLFASGWCFRVALAALGMAFAVFAVGALAALIRSPVRTHTVRAMRLALLALVATVAFGLALAAQRGLGAALPTGALHALHPGWGLLGWLGLLAAGVAFQVVPMFQITPQYPQWMRRSLVPAMFASLLAWSAASWRAGSESLASACELGLALGCLLFALTTLMLQSRSRRRAADVTLDFWRVGMIALAAASLVWLLRLPAPLPGTTELELLSGVLVLFGFGASIVNGMLYKIMPFIVWFHLQARTRGGRILPNLNTVLDVSSQRLQFRVHMSAFALLGAACVWRGTWAYPAALSLAASAMLLGVSMLKMLRTFTSTLAKYEIADKS